MIFLSTKALILFAIFKKDPIILEGTMLAGLVVMNVAGVFIAWRRENIGGTVTVIGAIVFGTFAYVTAGFNKGDKDFSERLFRLGCRTYWRYRRRVSYVIQSNNFRLERNPN